MLKVSELSELLDRLDGEPADALESETLEFKSWDPQSQQRKTQLRSLRETVFAFVNARGGLLVLGVADRKRTRSDAIQGVGNLVADGLRRDIYDGTEPHILVEVDELQEPEGRLLVVRVPRGLPPHTTTDGVARIRIGKDSMPLTGSRIFHSPPLASLGYYGHVALGVCFRQRRLSAISTLARRVTMNDPELLSRIAMNLDAYGWEVAP